MEKEAVERISNHDRYRVCADTNIKEGAVDNVIAISRFYSNNNDSSADTNGFFRSPLK